MPDPQSPTSPADTNPDPPRAASILPLSPTEKRVCSLLLKRLTEQRIAEQLERSPNTVHVHVRNIYRKLARKQLLEFPGIADYIAEDD